MAAMPHSFRHIIKMTVSQRQELPWLGQMAGQTMFNEPIARIELKVELVVPNNAKAHRVTLEDLGMALDRLIQDKLGDNAPEPEETPDGRPRRRLLSDD